MKNRKLLSKSISRSTVKPFIERRAVPRRPPHTVYGVKVLSLEGNAAIAVLQRLGITSKTLKAMDSGQLQTLVLTLLDATLQLLTEQNKRLGLKT